jgi:hypothetical protein
MYETEYSKDNHCEFKNKNGQCINCECFEGYCNEPRKNKKLEELKVKRTEGYSRNIEFKQHIDLLDERLPAQCKETVDAVFENECSKIGLYAFPVYFHGTEHSSNIFELLNHSTLPSYYIYEWIEKQVKLGYILKQTDNSGRVWYGKSDTYDNMKL